MNSNLLTCGSSFPVFVKDFFLALRSKLPKDDFVLLDEFDRTLVGGCGGLLDAEHGREHNFACNIVKGYSNTHISICVILPVICIQIMDHT